MAGRGKAAYPCTHQPGKAGLRSCLGGQQIAKTLGADIFQGEYREAGWLPIRTMKSETLGELPEELVVFHWHGEQFGLPEGAERLFTSEVCPNQGFIYKENVIGLQFHFESTKHRKHSPERCGLLGRHRLYADVSRNSELSDTREQPEAALSLAGSVKSYGTGLNGINPARSIRWGNRNFRWKCASSVVRHALPCE